MIDINEPVFRNMPSPTTEQLNSPEFEAIWHVIKSWDINVPESYDGYCNANGSHVILILNSLDALHEQYATGVLGG